MTAFAIDSFAPPPLPPGPPPAEPFGRGLTRQQKRRIVRLARKDPMFALKKIQGIETVEPYQERLARAVWENERVVVRSCHCLGKTWTMARIVLAIGSAYPGAKIVTTAPTARQVELLLWSEIRAGFEASRVPLGGKMLTKQWQFSADWWAVGFTTKKDGGNGQGQSNSGFQGVHSPVLVFVVFDEATGIAADVWKQLEGLMTSAHVKFVAIGNPTTKDSPFYACFSDPSYVKIHLSCFDSPNLPANGMSNVEELEREYDYLRSLCEEDQLKRLNGYKVVRPHLVTAKWVMAMALKLGLKHPLFVSKCLGDFPEEGEACLMPLGVVEAAQRRRAKLVEEAITGMTVPQFFIGGDIARMGTDKSVITRLRGVVHAETKVFVKRDKNVVSGATIKMVNDLPKAERDRGGVITIDCTGLGSGVFDDLVEYKRLHPLEWANVELREFHAANRFKVDRDGSKEEVEKRSQLYQDKKAEAFCLLAEAVRDELGLLDEDIYAEELPTILFDYTSKGQYFIEDKDAYKKRTGRGSPDHADSLSLANYGRYHRSGIGHWPAAKPNGSKPRAPSRKSGDKW
jgi:phage terminase large subunit